MNRVAQKFNECQEADCQGPILARGWCQRHYNRWWRQGDPNTVKESPICKRLHIGCVVENCEGEHSAKGYCRKHYRAYHKYGDPLITIPHLRGVTAGARSHARASLPADIKEAYGF